MQKEFYISTEEIAMRHIRNENDRLKWENELAEKQIDLFCNNEKTAVRILKDHYNTPLKKISLLKDLYGINNTIW